MTNTNANICFYCRKGQMNKRGEAKIELCINYCGRRFFITLPRKENPKIFKTAMKSKRENPIKNYCEFVKDKMKNQIFDLLRTNKEISKENLKLFAHNGFKDYISVEQIANEFLNMKNSNNENGLIQKETNKRYNIVIKRFEKYIGRETDIKSISRKDIEQFRIEIGKSISNNTVNLYFSSLKSFFKYAHENGYIDNNPTDGFKTTIHSNKIENFLSVEEIEKLRKTDCGKLEKIKDCFLFQIYTGLSYADYYKLTAKDIQKGNKGYFIKDKRKKTGIEYIIPLTDDAISILEKYDFELPKFKMNNYNRGLSKIETILGINKHITTHTARHTSATYLLNYGISKEIVQKILGHSSIKMTEQYAKLLDNSVIDEMTHFEERKEEKSKRDKEERAKFENKERLKRILSQMMKMKSFETDKITDEELNAIIDEQFREEPFNGELEKDFIEEDFANGRITEDEFNKKMKRLNE